MKDILFHLQDDHVHFNIGAPDSSLLPLDPLKNSISKLPSTALQYGPSLGPQDYLDQLSLFLSKHYNDTVVPEHLCATSGASQSFFNLLSFFTRPDTVYFIENPTYFLAIRMLEDRGLDAKSIIPISIDDHGLLIDELDQHLKNLPVPSASFTKTKRFSKVLFMVPTYSNPMGVSLSHERRKQLVELARKHDLLVICDDVYQLLSFPGYSPPDRLVSYDLKTLPAGGFGNIISNCSFSKLYAPGMRLGWVEAAPGIIQQMKNSGLLYSGGCSNQISCNLMTHIMASGELSLHLEHVRQVYRDRCAQMIAYFEKHLSSDYEFSRPTGGYFIWLKSKDTTLDTECLLTAMQGGEGYRGIQESASKVSFTPGNLFSVNRNQGHCLRLSFGMFQVDDLIKGCERLCAILNKIRK